LIENSEADDTNSGRAHWFFPIMVKNGFYSSFAFLRLEWTCFQAHLGRPEDGKQMKFQQIPENVGLAPQNVPKKP
jgi:hypothetical protein